MTPYRVCLVSLLTIGLTDLDDWTSLYPSSSYMVVCHIYTRLLLTTTTSLCYYKKQHKNYFFYISISSDEIDIGYLIHIYHWVETNIIGHKSKYDIYLERNMYCIAHVSTQCDTLSSCFPAMEWVDVNKVSARQVSVLWQTIVTARNQIVWNYSGWWHRWKKAIFPVATI